MTMMMLFILTIVDIIVTFYLMIMLISPFMLLPGKRTKRFVLKLFANPLTSFVSNFGVSMIIGYFTGTGMVAGAANLLASCVAAVALPFVIKRKYPEYA